MAVRSEEGLVPDDGEEGLVLDDGEEAGAGGDALHYATPEQLLGMMEHDPRTLMRCIKQVLEHVGTTGRLHPADLQLPILADPCCKQPLPGYVGEWYDPGKLGSACIFVPPSKGRGPNSKGDFGLNPDGEPSNKTETFEAGLLALRMTPRPHKGKSAPNLPGKFYKFHLEEPTLELLIPDAAPAASKGNRQPFVLMQVRKVQQTRAAVAELATAADDAHTPVDAPSLGTLDAASETTPDDSEEVTGLIERLSLPGAANSAGANGAGKGNRTLDSALALKTQGNKAFLAGEYPRALLFYSEATELLEGADEDASLAVILCNRSVAHLKHARPASALTDAARARALGAHGGGRAHFRLAEALSALGLDEEALESYKAALAAAHEGDKITSRDKIVAGLGRVAVRATPGDFARKLGDAVAGSTLLLDPGKYVGPFMITVGVRIVGRGGAGGVVLDSTVGGATLVVKCAGQVVLQGLDVRRSAGRATAEWDKQALFVDSGAVTADECKFTCAVGACVGVTGVRSSLVLRGGVVSRGNGAGVIVANSARVHGIKVTVRENQAQGFEVREQGELDLHDCELSNNRQGLLQQCGGKSVRMTRCVVTGHKEESGVLCCDSGELTMTKCTVERNMCGVTVEGGSVTMKGCEVRKQGMHGIMVQHKGSALLEHNNVHHNTQHGVFLGYDAKGRITMRSNNFHHNGVCGIENCAPAYDTP